MHDHNMYFTVYMPFTPEFKIDAHVHMRGCVKSFRLHAHERTKLVFEFTSALTCTYVGSLDVWKVYIYA